MAGDNEKPTNSSANEEEEEEEEEEEYVVEKIINHRFTKKGKLEYYLKWKGFSDADNTWEPADNLNCPDLVEVYETERKNKADKKAAAKTKPDKNTDDKKGKKRKSTTDEGSSAKKKPDKQPNGFEKGLTAEEIIGATENNGEVHFLIKWKEASHDYELIPSRIVNLKIPQMVISFYEARLTWSTASNAQDIDEEESLQKNGADNDDDEDVADEAPLVNGVEKQLRAVEKELEAVAVS